MKYLFIVFAAAGFLIACTPKTTEIIETDETATSTEGDMPKADIGEGKVVFLTKCTTCHYGNGPTNASQIDDYTESQFKAILPKMTLNAELNEDETRQVRAYIFWELKN